MSRSLCTAPYYKTTSSPAIPRCPPADLKAMQQRIRELEIAVVGEFVNVYNTIEAAFSDVPWQASYRPSHVPVTRIREYSVVGLLFISRSVRPRTIVLTSLHHFKHTVPGRQLILRLTADGFKLFLEVISARRHRNYNSQGLWMAHPTLYTLDCEIVEHADNVILHTGMTLALIDDAVSKIRGSINGAKFGRSPSASPYTLLNHHCLRPMLFTCTGRSCCGSSYGM
ncbi:hypothetical protein B0H19DRAFT_1264673 [Mycena capillaripes]|nr:hypothetical protein B0H19DRAFT_1264673 [Mycena capillaripes]